MRVVLASGGLLLAAFASANVTCLFNMPIADVLKHREAFAYAGFQSRSGGGYDGYGAATVGLYGRAEVGFDPDLPGSPTGCAKLQLLERGGRALSVGATGFDGRTADPFVVGRLDERGYRLHAGIWRTEGASRPMVGADFPAGRGLTGSVEALGGGCGQAWAALFYAVPQVPGLGVQLAIGTTFGERGALHAACVFYAFKV